MLLTVAFSGLTASRELTRAEFVAMISDYFAWPHPSEYNDIWKTPLTPFADVKAEDKYGKQIEVALEEGLIAPDALGNFEPNAKMTRQDAAVIFAKAFMVAAAGDDVLVNFTDWDLVKTSAKPYVKALFKEGFHDRQVGVGIRP